MLEALLALVAGLLIGSFLNVCIYRMPRDLSVVSPRSSCPACEHPIAWYDNIPIASFVVLHGRCRHCAKPIPFRYPIVEALTALLFFGVVLAAGPTASAARVCIFCALVIGLVFSDLEARILPDEFTLGGVALGLLFAVLAPFHPFWFSLLHWNHRWLSLAYAAVSALVPSLLLWGLGAAYQKIRHKEGLGLGDVKMVAMIGAFLGLEAAMLAVFAGTLLGSLIGISYIYLARKDPATYELPFGTFLGAGAIVVALMSLR
jgi:leader peptidase (prepilin peptidase) / N-methyltransferase